MAPAPPSPSEAASNANMKSSLKGPMLPEATLTLETHVQGLAQELQDLICDFVFTADSAEIVVIRKASQPLNSMLAVNRAFRTPFDPFLLLKPVCPTKAPTGSRIDSASLLNSPWIAERCIGAAGGV